MVNDILDLAKIECDAFEVVHEKFDLQDALADINDIFLFQCELRRVKFKIKLT